MAFIRTVLFYIFFAAGAGAVTLSILAEELKDYCNNKYLAVEKEAENEKIKRLTAEYDSQIKYIEQNPDVLSRLEHITLGTEPVAEDTAYPKVSDKQLAAAAEAILEQIESQDKPDPVAKWVRRCAEPNIRKSLFFAGTGLVLITFIFFAASSRSHPQQD